jgi:hypothetical protein
MRHERFDMAVLLTNSLRTAAVAWLGNAQQRIGYVRYGRSLLLTGKLYPQRVGRAIQPRPMVDTYLDIAEAIGCERESQRLELATVAADEKSADDVFRWLGLRGDGRIAALNSSGAYGAAKLWPVEYFGQLARRIVDELDHDVLVFCGPKERDIARQVIGHAHSDRVFSMADQPMDLGTSKACIRRCRFMVSTDSGPRKSNTTGDKSDARSRLHRLSQARLPARPSSLHARSIGRDGFRGGEEGVKEILIASRPTPLATRCGRLAEGRLALARLDRIGGRWEPMRSERQLQRARQSHR